jgi:hypothetical protein
LMHIDGAVKQRCIHRTTTLQEPFSMHTT